jgi:hypothetical protein
MRGSGTITSFLVLEQPIPNIPPILPPKTQILGLHYSEDAD